MSVDHRIRRDLVVHLGIPQAHFPRGLAARLSIEQYPSAESRQCPPGNRIASNAVLLVTPGMIGGGQSRAAGARKDPSIGEFELIVVRTRVPSFPLLWDGIRRLMQNGDDKGINIGA